MRKKGLKEVSPRPLLQARDSMDKHAQYSPLLGLLLWLGYTGHAHFHSKSRGAAGEEEGPIETP